MKLNHLSGTWNRIAGALVGLLLAFASLVQGYFVVGLIGGALRAPGAEPMTTNGIAIFVEDNGIHTGLVLPKAMLPADLIGRFAARDLADPRYARNQWLAFGWGDRAFYIGTPTWSDLSPTTVVRAAVGSDATVLHVEHVATPRGGPDVRRVMLSPAQFTRLIGILRATVADGRPVHGYGGWDAFYPANGRYSAIHTCNAWTGEALRAAGVPMGRWTPFPATVMWWL